ncbi:phenylacetic acid degradation protein [Oceanicola sp. 22II-s10i]|uniref:PaaI family thioesterase n=1 Tax=Oceanicola sp. 22II-s10i TaxID=1317116 RepID=UPI000B5267E4|nr:PaaI family thioesterase [Oceanicola sp. 22II-s10i]OWU83251.1 phenylacetic acid degradation protein [Oceanicola sp. 22II-s10i]
MNDSVFDRFPAPPIAEFLGWELISENPERGEIEVAFHPTDEMTNVRGDVQGGMIAAMLDDTMGPALLSMTGGKCIASSIDMNVSYMRPMKAGRVTAKGRVVRKGRTIAFLEAELFGPDGKMIARATSSAIPVDMP